MERETLLSKGMDDLQMEENFEREDTILKRKRIAGMFFGSLVVLLFAAGVGFFAIFPEYLPPIHNVSASPGSSG